MIDFRVLDSPAFYFYAEKAVVTKAGASWIRLRAYDTAQYDAKFPDPIVAVQIIEPDQLAFVLEGSALEYFKRVAGPALSQLNQSRFGGNPRFEAFGLKSIQLIQELSGREFAIKVMTVEEDLLDQRDRIVMALNRAIADIKPELL